MGAHQFLGNGVNGINNGLNNGLNGGLNGSLINNSLNLSIFSESMGKKDDCHGSDLQNHLQNTQLGNHNSQNLQHGGHNQTLLSECLILQDVLNGGPEAKIPKLEKLIQEVEKNDQNESRNTVDTVDDKNKPAEHDLDGSSNSKSVVVPSGQEAAEHDNTQ